MMAIDISERRNGEPGRRATDSHTCIFHEEFKTQNLNCLIAIKDRIKALERAMGGTLTFKIAGIITSVAMGFLILFIGAAFSMMKDLKYDIKEVNSMIIELDHRTDAIQNTQTKLTTQQAQIIKTTDEVVKKLNKN